MTKLGKNIIFPIYRDVNDVPTPFHDLALHKSTSDSIVMSLGDKITGDVYYKNNALDVTMTEYILVKRNPDDANERAVKFVLVNPPTIVREGMVADNSQLKGMTKYSFTFYHPMYMLGNLPFADVAVTDEEKRYLSESKKFNWIGNAQDYVAKLNKNLQGTEFVVRISDTLYNDPETRLSPKEEITRLSDVLTFDDAMIADALKTFYDTYGIPFVIDILPSTDSDYASGKRYLILMGLPSETIVDGQGNEFVFQFGQGVGLKNNSRTPRNNKIVTRVAGFGSEENIPYGYPQIRWYGPSDWTNTKNDESDPTSYPIYEGIVGGELVKLIKHPFTRTHLMPTIYETTVFNKVSPYVENGSANPDYDPDTTLVDYYDATAEKGYPNPINPNAPSYESHEFADIKPQLGHETGITSAIPQKWDGTTYVDDDHWDDTYDPDQDGYIQSYFKLGLPILSFDLYASAAITQQMNVVMRSGACLGCTFPVQIDWDDYKANFFNADGVFDPIPHTTEGDGHVRDITKYPDSSQTAIDILVKKENTTFGVVMPNIYQNPTAGDEIVFTGISLPQSYITMAQALLDQAMDDWMMENNVYYWDYPLKFDEDFLSKHTDILAQIRPNVRVSFMFANDTLTLYVKQLVIKYGEKVLPQYDITLTDDIEATRNAIGQAQADIGGLHTGLDRIGQAVQEITRKDRIQPSGSPTLPVYVNGNNEFKAIDGLDVPENIHTQKNVEAGYGVAAYGMASLAMNGGGGQGTVTAINFEGSPEQIYTPSDGLITLPDYPTAASLISDGLASQNYVASYFASNFTQLNIKNTLGISDWALASTKPSYNFSEIGSKPTTLAGYNITDAHITNGVVTLGQNTITPATLNNGKIPLSQIPDAILGQMLYGGTVNGSGVVTLSQNAKDKWGITSLTLTSTNYADYEGAFFIASANGSSGVPSSLGVLVGDWIIATSAGWGKIDNTDAVTGVKGSAESNYRIGNVNITPANIGLGNVENTALSTWTGSIKIVTLGTINTGVWHGSAIADDYIASASAWNAKYDKDPNGIPLTDLASAVQTSLGKADTALQSESDPVFTASAAYGITSGDITAWNNKQNALAFDGTYDASTNKVATKSTVTNAINALDVSNISGFGAGKTLASLTETDGKIAATFQNISITKSQVSDFPTTWALANITGADDLKAIEALTGTSGFLKKTAANTWSLDTDVASGTALSGVSTRVGTLEGYFTSGVANNAAQLGGQLPSYYAVAADYTKTTDFQSFSIKVGTTTLGTYSPTSALILSLVAGSNIAFDTDATNHKLTIRNTYSYTLPMASADSRGGIRVGNTLNIDSNGILNANIYDGLDQGYTTYALSAKQGKALNTALGTLKTGLTSKGAHNLPIYLNSNAQAVAIDALSVSGNVESTAGGVSASGIASLAMNGGGGQGTLTQIQVNGVALADTSGVVNITATTGNAAGKIAIAGQQIPVYGLGSFAYLSSLAFTDLSSHPTTLGGYGITDAKIANGVITLGSNTITPITSLPTFYNLAFQNGNSVVDTYKPTTSPSKTIKAGSNVTISAASNVITIAATNTWTPWAGATSSAAGTAGYMPAPTSAQRNQFLRGDGTWVSLNNYSLPLAANGTRGGVQIGYTTDGANRNYAVQLSSEKMYVNVPWTDTDTKVTSAANHYTPTSESYTPTAGSWSWNSTEVVVGITKDSKGHIVGVTTTKIANPNTDTKVTQTVTSSSNTSWRPLLIGQSYSDASPFAPTTTTDTVYATHLAKFAPKDGLLAIRGLNKMNTDGTLVNGSEYKVFNTNGGVSNLAAWAQADSKPSYTYSEVGAAASSHTHGNIQNGGTLQTNDVSIANGDKLVITDASDGVKVARSGITFDASTTNKALTPKGTWESFLQGNQTITLSGDVSGSGATSIAVTIGASKVTNAMLAGSIANNKLANSSISIAGTSVSLGGSITAATLKSNLGLGASAYLGYDTTVTKDSAKLITSGAVWTAIDNLPEPMVFKGSLGTGGTIIALPTNGSASIGDTYKVITAGTYASKAAKVGDTFICLTKTSSANTWEIIPSGDEPSGTVTSVGLSMPTGFSVSSSPVTSSGTLTVAFASGYSLPTTAKQGNWDDAYDKRHTHSSLTLSTTAQAYDGTHTLALPASDPYTSARTPSSHASSGTGYGVGTTSNYGHVKLATGDMNGASGADGVAVGKNHTHSQYALAANLGTASTHAHVDYVTAIGTSGNTLTWSKGGTAQTAITVPYATAAGKLNTNAGSATNPVYFANGVPVACTYSLNKTVPADAVFTDTNTHRPIQLNGTEILGNNTTALNLKAGTNVSLSNSNGTVTIAATDTTYSANNGVGLSGTTFYNSGVRAATINGNYLRINTNGTNADLTIPYATNANYAATAGSAPASDVYPWAKAASKPSYHAGELGVTPTSYKVTSVAAGIAPYISDIGTNIFSGATTSEITVERSLDNGATWTDVTSSEAANVKNVFSGCVSGNLVISGHTKAVVGDRLRITFNPSGGSRYCQLAFIYVYFNTNGCGCLCNIEKNLYTDKTAWTTYVADAPMAGWSGPNIVGMGGTIFGQNDSRNEGYGLRFTFRITSVNANYDSRGYIYTIQGFTANKAWGTPSGNSIAKTNTPYTYVNADRAVSFDNTVAATGFYENGTALSSKYLGISAKAADSDKLDGNDSSYFQPKVSALGSSTQPVYISAAGTFSTCDLSTTYAPYNANGYLPLNGGTLTASNNVLNIASTNEHSYIYFKSTVSGSLANRASVGYYSGLAFVANEVAGYARIGVANDGTPQYWSNNQSSTAKTLWHSGNDGSGSGLDADLLDGQHGSYYQPKVSALGSTTEPVYISAAGTFSKASKYAGGTAVTLNGTSAATSTASFYAPTGAGTSGQILKSTAGTPEWMNQSALVAGKATILETTHTIWGRDFNGSANVTGDMSNVGNIAFSASGKNIGGTMYFDTNNHRVGINDSTPSCAFDVTGDVQASGGIAAGGILNLAYNGAGTQGTLTQIQINGRALTDTSGIVNIPLANTTSTGDGAMSHSDKLKLDGIATGATNVNTDTVAGWGYTKNAGTVTGVKMNGSVKGSSGVVDLGTVITDVSGKADKQMNVLVDNNGSATITMTNSTTARYHFVRYPSSSSVSAITLQQATSALTAANCGTAHYELFKNEKSTAITLTLTKYSNSSYYLIAPSKTITIPANSSVELSYIHIAGASSTFYTVVTIGDVMINVS